MCTSLKQALEGGFTLEVVGSAREPIEVGWADLGRRLRVFRLEDYEGLGRVLSGTSLEEESVDALVVVAIADVVVGLKLTYADDIPKKTRGGGQIDPSLDRLLLPAWPV